MTKVREIYRCQICGNVVEVVNPGAVLSCCGEPMKLMKENTSDGAKCGKCLGGAGRIIQVPGGIISVRAV